LDADGALEIALPQQLVKIFLVQHAGFPGPKGNQALPAFQKAADETFAK